MNIKFNEVAKIGKRALGICVSYRAVWLLV